MPARGQFKVWTLEEIQRRSVHANGCMEWQGKIGKNGYGYLCFNGKEAYAHRLVFFLTHGRWPALNVCHTCDNRKCVNSVHLFEGTGKDNTHDMIRKGRYRGGSYKLTARDVLRIKVFKELGLSQKELGSLFSVGQGHISRILNGKRRVQPIVTAMRGG